MYRRMITLSVLFLGIVIFTVGSVYVGYLFFARNTSDTGDEMVLSAYDDGMTESYESELNELMNDLTKSTVPEAEISESRITDKTRIIYEYVTETEADTELREVNMPLYFLGMTEDVLDDALLEGWSIKEFDEDVVVLNRTVRQSAQDMYTLGVHNGYVAVFYNDDTLVEEVKETTGMPFSVLSIEEQNRLLDGIMISDDDQLMKALEDYGS